MKLKLCYTWVLFLIATFSMVAQNIEISGTVKDESGTPTVGVLVLVKGTQRGATTDMDGKYSIQAKAGDVLQYSFLGMKSVERKVTASSKRIDIVLKDDIQELEEMVVTGYGAPKIASRTVAVVSQVQGKDVGQSSNANVADALQGRIAGLVVTNSSGQPGARSEILIHGFNNFEAAYGRRLAAAAGSDPLVIMDGVAVDSGVLSDFNSNDIENITILKDAASTSIYGARAANGVILITTKRGRRNERTNITISHQLGFTALTNASTKFFENMMTSREYMDFWLEKNPRAIISAAGMTGNTREIAEAAANKILEENPYNTRWDKIYFRNFVPLSRTDVSVSGGTQNTSYHLSLGYFKQEGATAPASDYLRYTLNGSIDTQITSWLKTGLNFSVGHSERESSSSETNAQVTALPFYSPTNPDGSRKDFIPSILRRNTSGFHHPEYYAEKHPNNSVGEDFLPSLYVTIEPIKNLIFKTQGGVQYSSGETDSRELPSYIDYRTNRGLLTTNQFARISNSRTLRKTFTNTLEYRFLLASKHSFNALLGQESIENREKALSVSSYGQPSDGLSMLMHGNRNYNITEAKTIRAFNSFFGRLEYSYNSRYFLDLSARRDGSSAFGRNHQYANFWAVGAMWKLKQEKFLKEVKWLTDLNLRFSTGLSGNAGGSGYRHLTTVRADSNYYNQQTGYVINLLGNQNLTWEEQRKSTLGLNIVLDRSTSFNIEYYDRETYGMLSSRQTNSASGFDQYPDNAGGFRNRGLDFTFSSVVYRSKNESLTIRPYMNLNYNKQELIAIFGTKESEMSTFAGIGYKLGRPLEWGAVMVKGVNPQTGDLEYYVPGEDRMEKVTDDNNVTTTYNQSNLVQTTGKKMQAPINGGLGWNIAYKTFSVDMSFSFSIGRYMRNLDPLYTENPTSFAYSNLSKNAFDYWKQPGDVTRHPKISSNYFFRSNLDSRLLEDASFLRLKNISVSYRLPKEVINQIKFFDGVRLYATARNIFTLTKYTGADPEMSAAISLGGYPPSRQFTLGVELNF